MALRWTCALGLSLSVCGAAASGCIGHIGDDDSSTDEPGFDTQCAAAPDVEPTLVRMLNRREYANTVRDLLGVSTAMVDDFPADPIVGFDNRAESLVASSLLVEKHLDAVETFAADADLSALVPCAAPDSCVDEFIASFGRRAYRRPLADDEIAVLRTTYQDAQAAGRSVDASIRLVIEAALMSPQFLYRAETTVSATGGLVPVEPYELASRLSYFLWASMPDDELLDAADAGALATPEQVEAQARRMLDDPKAHEVTKVFHDMWLQLYKLSGITKVDPGYITLAPLFADETAQFVDYVFWGSAVGAREYLLSDVGFASGALAAHYGDSERFGLLTQGSILSLFSNPDRTSPTKRGKFVRQQLLCQPPPPPPANVPPLNQMGTNEGTLRERLSEHMQNPACKSCHQLIDPIGFGLEHYDTVGAYRTEDAGAPVDASGELLDVHPGAGTFVGARELSERLADTEEFYSCIAEQWFRFAVGRDDGPRDACTLDGVSDAFRASGDALPELLVAIARSNAFLLKNTEPSQ